MFRKLLSFLIPINIHKSDSAVSKSLEVTWNNGELVLDSRHTNYSFGSLQRILRRGLKLVGFGKIRSMNHILVLGVAGGSVIQTLRKEIKFEGRITGVEIDKDVLELANKYFGLDQTENFDIVIADAFEFVLRTKAVYDLIIIDIFKDTEMPSFLFEDYFVGRLSQILPKDGYILFNTMTLTNEDNYRNDRYIKAIDSNMFFVETLPRVEQHNQLIILKKL